MDMSDFDVVSAYREGNFEGFVSGKEHAQRELIKQLKILVKDGHSPEDIVKIMEIMYGE